ncbi:MAG: beta-phosphoglucomutase [Bacteroidales bacterium]|nr:MAG: beta-phosphoglucomutase [Bacteroidales bacterium]
MKYNNSIQLLRDRNIKAIFFDMDGILFDSMPHHAEAWTKALNEYGFEFSKYDVYKNEGRTGDSTINELHLAKYGTEASPTKKKDIYDLKAKYFNQLPEAKIIPNVAEVLNFVKELGLTIVLVTGSAQISLLDKLELNFPHIFTADKMVTAFDVKYGKPNPEPYLIALDKAKVKSSEAIVVENAPLGVRASIDAGIFTIAVNTGILKRSDLSKEGANIVLDNMIELKNLFLKLNAEKVFS